jgi:methionyl-tRNA formyltransferase
LRENESQTGVTFHDLTPEIDAGNILFQSELPIYAHDDYTSLARRIAYRAKETVGHALANVGQPGVPQTPEEASYFYRPKPEDYWLDWSLPAEKLRNLIRSAQGHYYRTRHGDMGLNITHSEFVDLHEPCTSPGLVLYKSGSRLLVSTGDSHKGLFVQASPFNNRLGEFGAKLYCLNKVKVGDRFV